MTQVFLTTADTSPWSRPRDFKDNGHTVELIGGGGDGGGNVTGANYRSGSGGGGGGYTKLTNGKGYSFFWKNPAIIQPTTPFKVGANNTSTSDANTSAGTFWGSSTFTNCYGASGGLAGASASTTWTPGGIGIFLNPGAGGTANVPLYTQTSYTGGAGGNSAATTTSAGGGGGAGGPSGSGGQGGSTLGTASYGGGGGGGSNGGTAGANTTSATGGNGGNGVGGSGQGTGATTTANTGGAATAGSGGGGGGGAFRAIVANVSGGIGANDVVFSATTGSGGGGGGAGATSVNTSGCTTNGGNGANYGGGGGGAGGTRNGTATSNPGSGGKGLIVITYQPAVKFAVVL